MSIGCRTLVARSNRARVKKKPMTPETKRRNERLKQLNTAIARMEGELAQAYLARAGMCLHDDAGYVFEAWCACCGKNPVNPNHGEDTCRECLQNI